ncbi:polysaccharide biosynthesis/export family protein [Salipiger mucosus]|uniref:EPS I polysaccharide export outer membrane protein EPSA n=1 Tax=Salipiger mucosus DSM 16094 TaxID=1123237 RepID=S9QGH4_9RHOB|nr:polysaccharide biosynthesis/export family protein [Salipiger mucosus]EPX80521.1 EPS I polysaccharide export outer membrane protein EPSA precursor [Salipiger mucosus DSM 16094]
MVPPLHRQTARAVALVALAACSAPREAANIEPVAEGGAYQAQYRDIEVRREAMPILEAPRINAESCRPPIGGTREAAAADGGKAGWRADAALRGDVLSRGDLVDLMLPGDETFSGDYVISRDGTLKVPFLAPIPAQGRTTAQVGADLRRALVAGDYYDTAPETALLVQDYAPARVTVSGAVFEPQPVTIGGVPGDQVDTLRQAALGASTEGRNLSVALRNAGGVRPDADLSAVRLTRGGTTYTLDLRGAVDGTPFDDVMLITGDQVEVPSRLCFQDDLMKPSPVSPAGISLYMSNLTQPATGNAPSAIGETVRQVPYGTRYMQAVVDLNCVGGARASSADRSAALFSRNPMTDVSVVVERKVEVMRTRADRDDYDPYLLPGDALACYDSGVTNVTEVARVLGVVGALTLLR